MSIKILLADRHKMRREGLRALLESEPDMEVIAEAATGLTTVQLAGELSPDIVVMDIEMPNLNGIGASRRIVPKFPSVKVVALSLHSDRPYVTQTLKAGASGYLLKGCSFEELARAIKAVAAGHMYLSPSITRIVVEDYVPRLSETNSSALSTLTPRQHEVLQLLIEGKSTREIASLLEVSVKTVGTHRMHVMKKLDVHSIAELTKYAIREGLITPEP
jgi:DNA-binding NarL/FixJ family response regulator